MTRARPTFSCMERLDSRRGFLAIASAGALLAACRKEGRTEPQPPDPTALPGEAEAAGEGIGAVEDLRREHGVFRRVLVVYREAASRLRGRRPGVPGAALRDAAALMRTFGEDYHERQLEEAHVFPAVRKVGGPAAGLLDTLLAQHQRGREITDYVLAVSIRGIGAYAHEPLARALDAFARMYEAHAAHEDAVVFQAWRASMSPVQLAEAGELFEAIERRTFGRDGFDEAVERVGSVERAMGIELASFTAPPAAG